MNIDSDDVKKSVAPYLRPFIKPRKGAVALLVVDMQNYFATLSSEILIPLCGLVEVCRATNIPVIYTAHSHEDPEKDGGMLGQWWGDLILASTRDAEIIEEIAPLPNEKVISKKRYNAFHGSDLEEHLRSHKIEELIIGGVMTNLCCETTARDAFVRDFRVYFLADGTATAGEEMHMATLKNLAFGFAHIVTCGEMMEALSPLQ